MHYVCAGSNPVVGTERMVFFKTVLFLFLQLIDLPVLTEIADYLIFKIGGKKRHRLLTVINTYAPDMTLIQENRALFSTFISTAKQHKIIKWI